MEDSTCVSCGHCATVCPTGSLVEKGIEDATTIPLPGFNQKNSVGKTIEGTGEDKEPMTQKKRQHSTNTNANANANAQTDGGTASVEHSNSNTEDKNNTNQTDDTGWKDISSGEWP